MNILVSIGSQYGNLVLRPANDAARTLAKIAGTKTLLVSDLVYAEKLGHTFEFDGTKFEVQKFTDLVNDYRARSAA